MATSSAAIVPVEHADAPPPRYSVQEYLAQERQSSVRNEYLDGEIRAMAGESPQHNRLAGNVYIRLETAFDDRRCEAYIEGVRLRVTPTRYRYPDVMALCGEARFDDDNPPALLNPGLIVEVLSASTEESDRDEKFTEYRQIESLTEYLLIAQDRMEVTLYQRQSPTQWTVTIYTMPDETLLLTSVNVVLALSGIYRKVFNTP